MLEHRHAARVAATGMEYRSPHFFSEKFRADSRYKNSMDLLDDLESVGTSIAPGVYAVPVRDETIAVALDQ